MIYAIFAAAALLAIAAVVYVRRRKAQTSSVGRVVPVKGLGAIGYSTAQLDLDRVHDIIFDLISTRDNVWPQYQDIYRECHDYYMDRITLNTEFHKVAELDLGTHKMTLNPSMDYQRGFAAELHNLYRFYVHGPLHIYCDEAVNDIDRTRCLAGEFVWREV